MKNEPLELTDIETLEEVVTLSDRSPVIIFKHSETCPVSVQAWKEVEDYMDENFTPVYKLVVQESRELSNKIAEEFGVQHESPQILIISGEACVFDTSHYDITKSLLEEILKED